jgi:hypothetical protein
VGRKKVPVVRFAINSLFLSCEFLLGIAFLYWVYVQLKP